MLKVSHYTKPENFTFLSDGSNNQRNWSVTLVEPLRTLERVELSHSSWRACQTGNDTRRQPHVARYREANANDQVRGRLRLVDLAAHERHWRRFSAMGRSTIRHELSSLSKCRCRLVGGSVCVECAMASVRNEDLAAVYRQDLKAHQRPEIA